MLARRLVRDSEQLGVRRWVPAVRGAVTDGHRGHARHAEPLELIVAFRVRLDVDRVELDPPRREELIRLGAGRSARAVEKLDGRSGNSRRILIGHVSLLKGNRAAIVPEDPPAGRHRPLNVGVCFRANAVTPFLKSSVWPLAAIACASSSICVSRLSHVDWWKSRLAPPNAFVGPWASSRAIAATVVASSASGTTRVTSPHSSASFAESTRLVK